MICYKDITFCSFYKKCKNGKNCKIALTPEVKTNAENWWKGYKSEDSAPICEYVDKPECFEEII